MSKALLITFLVLFTPFSFAVNDNEQPIEVEMFCRSDEQREKVDFIVKPFYKDLKLLYAFDGRSYHDIFMDIIVFGSDDRGAKNILLLYNQSFNVLLNAYHACIEEGAQNGNEESYFWELYKKIQQQLMEAIKIYVESEYNPSIGNE